jgi:hypothetical protein
VEALHAATATVRQVTLAIHRQVPLLVPLEHHKEARPVITRPIAACWRTPRQCGLPLLPPVMVMDRVRPAALRPGRTENPGVGGSTPSLSTIFLCHGHRELVFTERNASGPGHRPAYRLGFKRGDSTDMARRRRPSPVVARLLDVRSGGRDEVLPGEAGAGAAAWAAAAPQCGSMSTTRHPSPLRRRLNGQLARRA